jgi:hypothetical protein
MAFAIKVRLEINSKIFPYSYVTIIEIPTRMGDNSPPPKIGKEKNVRFSLKNLQNMPTNFRLATLGD